VIRMPKKHINLSIEEFCLEKAKTHNINNLSAFLEMKLIEACRDKEVNVKKCSDCGAFYERIRDACTECGKKQYTIKSLVI
jgi:CRISPR/Cas system-associated protein Csm6